MRGTLDASAQAVESCPFQRPRPHKENKLYAARESRLTWENAEPRPRLGRISSVNTCRDHATLIRRAASSTKAALERRTRLRTVVVPALTRRVRQALSENQRAVCEKSHGVAPFD